MHLVGLLATVPRGNLRILLSDAQAEPTVPSAQAPKSLVPASIGFCRIKANQGTDSASAAAAASGSWLSRPLDLDLPLSPASGAPSP